jgi:hypothetical protein
MRRPGKLKKNRLLQMTAARSRFLSCLSATGMPAAARFCFLIARSGEGIPILLAEKELRLIHADCASGDPPLGVVP